MEATQNLSNAERRKQVRLRLRPDLDITVTKYEGRTCHVVKDPVSLKYYRFSDQEYYVISRLDGKHTLEETQKDFEKEYRPHRLSLEDLEAFARQLISAGLVHHESAHGAKHLFDNRQKQQRMRWLATWTNILYIKIPLIDPDRILTAMLPWTWWIFTSWFLVASITLMLSAVMLVATNFPVFWSRLPEYQEFFQFNTFLYMWISLGIVKVIHEFGHGLSCKAFGGECHEMGALFLCFSPALYCNVSDSWTLPNKWKRITISFAGIYVELVIAAIATWVWWYSRGYPIMNNIALCLMILCSVSTVVFNANPLMRYDGYYMLADWLEIPNLSQRANKYLQYLVCEYCLGIEQQPEPYMALRRRVLFVVYAVVSYVYRWVVTFGIIWFLSTFLKPYKLGALSMLLAIAAVSSMVGWPTYRMIKGLRQRGRLPDMKMPRVMISSAVLAVLLAGFFFLPLWVFGRVVQQGVTENQAASVAKVDVPMPGGSLERLYARDGEWVTAGQPLASFRNLDLEMQAADLEKQAKVARGQAAELRSQLARSGGLDARNRLQLEQEADTAAREEAKAVNGVNGIRAQLNALAEVVSPHDGFLMSPPRPEDLGRKIEPDPRRPLASVGDRKAMKVRVPVTPTDYRLFQEDLAALGHLTAEIHVPGGRKLLYKGRVLELPAKADEDVPIQLTQRGGGPLAVKPSSDQPDKFVPQGQYYLVDVLIDDPDGTICPGTLAHTRIHGRWRTGAWWTWRFLSSSLDLGLI